MGLPVGWTDPDCAEPAERDDPFGAEWEAGIPRVANGIPHRVNRLKAIGNAGVPQIVEEIGRGIIAVGRGRSVIEAMEGLS